MAVSLHLCLVILLAASGIPVRSAACISSSDCSLNGICTGGVCVCDKPWSGTRCGLLPFADKSPAAGQCLTPTHTHTHKCALRSRTHTHTHMHTRAHAHAHAHTTVRLIRGYAFDSTVDPRIANQKPAFVRLMASSHRIRPLPLQPPGYGAQYMEWYIVPQHSLFVPSLVSVDCSPCLSMHHNHICICIRRRRRRWPGVGWLMEWPIGANVPYADSALDY